MTEVILTVDIGSSSVKCFAYTVGNAKVSSLSSPSHLDEEQTVEFIPGAQASRTMRAVSAQTGKIVNLPDILQAAEDCVSHVLVQVDKSLSPNVDYVITGVGFSSFTMNLVGVDMDGELVGEEATLSYACNTREVVQEVEALKRQVGDEALRQLYQRTGTPLHSAYALPQLRVLYNTQPELCEDIDLWQSISNLLIGKWTGASLRGIPLSYSEASWTGLLNFRTCTYETTALALLPSDACRQALAPMVCDFDEAVYNGLAPEYEAKWPQLAQASFFLGLGDGACANIGSKCSIPTRIACTIGTSAAARVCVPLPILPLPDPPLHLTTYSVRVPDGLFCYRIDRYHVLLGGALTDGGSVVEWLCQLLRLNEPKEFDECMENVGDLVHRAEEKAHDELLSQEPPSKQNSTLTMVPFLSGERSTGHRGGASGVLFGITRETTATDLVQSSLEGVTLRLGAIVQRIQQVVIPAATATVHSEAGNRVSLKAEAATKPQIIVSGKGLEVNYVWRQMISNCTGLYVILDKTTLGGTSRGVALMVHSRRMPSPYAGLLPIESLSNKPESSLHHVPRPNSRTYWKNLEEQQEGLITAVSPLYVAKR